VERRTALLLIAIALAAYGVYHAIYAIAMLPVPASLLLLLGFALQAVLAILAAVGVWREQHWAATVLLLLGASIAATAGSSAPASGSRPATAMTSYRSRG